MWAKEPRSSILRTQKLTFIKRHNLYNQNPSRSTAQTTDNTNTKPLSSRSSIHSAKIDSSDRKRKKTSSSISSSRDKDKDKDKDKHKQKKKTRMSSSKTTATTNQVRASHILIKHQGSRRKASWKDPEGRVIMNTTRDSAVSQLKSIRDDIVSGKAKFDDLATRLSDCSSAKRGGDLGQFLLFIFGSWMLSLKAIEEDVFVWFWIILLLFMLRLRFRWIRLCLVGEKI